MAKKQKAKRASTPDELHSAAVFYLKLGLSFIPIRADGSKTPDWTGFDPVLDLDTGKKRYPWRGFKEKPPTRDVIDRWYGQQSASRGIAIVTGAVSGHLEVIDCDTKDVANEFENQLRTVNRRLLARLVRVESPKGRHYYFRTKQCGRTTKLAMKPDAEKDGKRPKTLIDFKAEGGYVLAPPSPPSCHPSGKRYQFLDGRDFRDLAVLTPNERDLVLDSARQCNTWIPPTPQFRRRRMSDPGQVHGLPGEDFNVRADWAEILEPHYWTLVGSSGDCLYWRRPGKGESGHSATTGFGDADRLHVFSTNAPPFEGENTYSKFAAYTLLNHAGDYSAAARALLNQGYGIRGWRSVGPPRPRRIAINFVPRSIQRM